MFSTAEKWFGQFFLEKHEKINLSYLLYFDTPVIIMRSGSEIGIIGNNTAEL